MRNLRRLFCVRVAALACGALAMSACGDSPTAPLAYAAFSTTDLRVGTGDAAAAGNVVEVNYSLWLYDPAATDGKGPMVESNAGGEPFEFRLSTGAVIQGFNDGVRGMLEGGLRRVIVPPTFGYGPVRNGKIPPNSTLVFEIELVNVVI